jgi:hypothetical protein
MLVVAVVELEDQVQEQMLVELVDQVVVDMAESQDQNPLQEVTEQPILAVVAVVDKVEQVELVDLES